MARRTSAGSIWRTSTPSSSTAPSVGLYSARASFSSVVLPEPMRPMMPTFSPGLILNDTFFSAGCELPG